VSSFIAAGTAYATHGINMIPFFIFYSMFGFQRIGDLIWAGADMRMKGFLLGGTSGRTTLNGEGLQHEDGHSHVLALPGADLPVVRSGVRLRAGGDHRGRHQADVRDSETSSTTSR
jgi:pyruvate dehydrogenase E1 component